MTINFQKLQEKIIMNKQTSPVNKSAPKLMQTKVKLCVNPHRDPAKQKSHGLKTL